MKAFLYIYFLFISVCYYGQSLNIKKVEFNNGWSFKLNNNNPILLLKQDTIVLLKREPVFKYDSTDRIFKFFNDKFFSINVFTDSIFNINQVSNIINYKQNCIYGKWAFDKNNKVVSLTILKQPLNKYCGDDFNCWLDDKIFNYKLILINKKKIIFVKMEQ